MKIQPLPGACKTIFFFLLFNAFPSFSQNFTDSNLPIIIINTDSNPNTGQPLEIQDDPRILATMKIIKRPDGTRNYVSDQNNVAYLNYSGRINIEIRGSSSQFVEKKQYGLTTLQSDNTSNNNVSLLGMPSENDWILNGLAFDPSLIRDYLSYNLSRQIGNYAPRTEYCEIIINGDYRGLYILQEKIKADSDRVNIVKIAASDTALPNLSGGYITKSDKTTGNDPVAWTMSSYAGSTDFIHDLPKPEDVTPEQNAYIHSRFTALATTSHTNNTDLANGYPSVIDIPSFVDFMISNELASNVDGYQLSTYFHKDRNGKLRAGPIFDFNLTYGNDVFGDRSRTDVWQFSNDDNEGAKFWTDLFNNAEYKCYFSRRWNQLTSPGQPLKHNNLVTYIDQIVSSISEAVPREHARWGTVPDHTQEIDNLKTFLFNRINWITSHIGPFSACSNIATPSLVIDRINYNPGTSVSFPISNDQEFIEITNAGNTSVNLTGIYFRELGITYQFPANTSIAAGGNIFLASNPTVFQQKYGVTAFGQFTRNLSNSSQKLVLADGFGNTIDSVQYFDTAPWPDADGNGSYLQLIDNTFDNNLASSWTASSATNLPDNDFSSDSQIAVSPNPVQNVLHIEARANIDNVDLFDMYGKKIESIAGGSHILEIPFSAYANGLYFVKIDSGGKMKVSKILKN